MKMMKLGNIFILGLVFSFLPFIASAVNPGIKLEVTETGLKQIQDLADNFIHTFIQNNEPFDLPNQNWKDVIYVTNMKIKEITYQIFGFDFVTGQINVFLNDLSFDLSYDLSVDLVVSNYSGTAVIKHTNTTLVFLVGKTSDGHPLVTLSDIKLIIGDVDLGLPTWLNDVTNLFMGLIKYVIEEVAPGEIEPIVNTDLNTFISQYPMSTFLDSNHKTLIDYSLLSAPSITDTQILVELKGDIHAVNVNGCPITPEPIPSIQTDNLRAYVSETLLDCFLIAYQESGSLDQLIQQLLKQYLHLDDRLKLDIQADDTSSKFVVSPSGLQALLNLHVGFYREATLPELYMSIIAQINAEAIVYLNSASSVANITGNIKKVDTNLNVSYIASDVPEKFKQQIDSTDFSALSNSTDSFIASAVLPTVNQLLANGYALPSEYTQFFKRMTLQFQEHHIFLGADLLKSEKPSTIPIQKIV